MGFKNILWQGSSLKQDASNRLVTDKEKTIWNNKANNSHTHTKSEVGLGNVDNTADSTKSVKYATSAGSTSNVIDVGAGSDDKSRHVWFSNTNPETSRVYSDKFQYNPATDVLTVGSITGSASSAASVPWSGVTGKPSTFTPSAHTHAKSQVGLGNVDNTADSTKSVKYATSAGSATKATQDSASQQITTTYIKGLSVSGRTITYTKGDNTTGTITTQDTNTDTKVTQSVIKSSDYTNWRPIIWGSSNSANEGFTPTTVTDSVFSDPNLTYQPSSGTLRATVFKGKLSGTADVANSVAWGNVSGRPSSLPASDVYSWAKASSKPSYTWNEIASKPSTFTPSAHNHDTTYLKLSGGTMTGRITFSEYGNSYIYSGNSDSAPEVGAKELGNLVISSWSGVSFTTSCEDQAYTNKTAVSIDCRNSIVKADYFKGLAENSNKLGGYAGSSSSAASTYVLRDSSKFVHLNYINSDTPNTENPDISQIIVTNGDNYYRKASLDHLRVWLDTSTMINKLTVGTSDPVDSDFYIAQYANGGDTTTTYHRRSHSALWNYINSKASSVYSKLSHTHTKSQITDFPSSLPASDVYAWAKASSKPSYSWSEITSKPSTFTPSSHTHNYAGSSSAGGSANTAIKLLNARSIFGQSFDGSADIGGQGIFFGSYTGTAKERFLNCGIEIRENGLVGSTQTDQAYAPSLGFNWNNEHGGRLLLNNEGALEFRNKADGKGKIIGGVIVGDSYVESMNFRASSTHSNSTIGNATSPFLFAYLSNVYPASDGSGSIGSSTKRYRTVYTTEIGTISDLAEHIYCCDYKIYKKLGTNTNPYKIGNFSFVSDNNYGYAELCMTRVFKENAYHTACIVPSNNTSTANKSITVYLPSSSGTLQIASSDIKLKDNINECEISDAISFINKIHLHSFDWKTDGYHQPIGFVADELKELDNNLSIGGNSDELDENGLPIDPKCVNTFYLQGYEVKAIQELSSKVDALEKENEELKSRLTKLEDKLSKM